MRKSIKLGVVAMLTACVACFSSATVLVDTGFRASDTPAYYNGDLSGQNGWAQVTGTGANAFNVTDSSGSGFANTIGASIDTNYGNYVYSSASIGNAASNELSGSLDFTLSSTTNTFNGGAIFCFGISSTVNTNFNGADSNQVFLTVNDSNAGLIRIQGGTAGPGGTNTTTMFSMPAAEVGWSATNVLTDPLRLTWKIRKTANINTTNAYAISASLANLVNGSNRTGSASTVKEGAYAASPIYFMMGHSKGTVSSNDGSFINITIDNLSITNITDVTPVLSPTTITAVSGNGVVDLTWDLVNEAESYVIERTAADAGINGTYNPIYTNTGSVVTYSDIYVDNGSVYYYRVVAKATGVADATSAPAKGEPDAAKTGTIINTHFRNTDSPAYANGDLAEQNKWKSITASGAPAFEVVDAAGSGFADTAPYSNSFDNVNGNQVFFNTPMSNGLHAAWSGTNVFTLKATADTSVTRVTTNDVGDVTTNIQMVATINEGRVFEFGISSDISSTNPALAILAANGKAGDALISLRTTTTAGFRLLLNGYNATANLMLAVPQENMGWDPEWANKTNAAPDFETDPITLGWTLQKTVSNNVYAAQVSVSVGTNSYVGTVQYTADKPTQPVDLYTNPVARFGMSHTFSSQTNSANTMVDVSIDSLSLSHSNDAPIIAAAPLTLTGVIGNTNVTLGWSGALEASSFDIYRADGYSNTTYSLRGTVTNVFSYTDGNLTNLVTYSYKVVANYASASNTTPVLSVIARGRVDVVKWEPVGKVTANVPISQTNKVVVGTGAGAVANIYGCFDGTNQAFMYPGVGPGTYTNDIPVYGVMQVTNTAALATPLKNFNMLTTMFEVLPQNTTPEYSSTVAAAMIYVKPTNGPVDMVTKSHTYEMTASASTAPYRAAFRDSANGKWYVSDNNNDTNGMVVKVSSLFIPDLASPTNVWRELTVTQSELMCGSNNPVTVPSFTAVDAVGYFMEKTADNIKTTLLKISAVDALPTYTITTTTDGRAGVDISPTNPVVNFGDSPVFTISGGTNGFRVATLKTNGSDVAGMSFDNTNKVVTFTWPNVTATGSVSATFTEILYNLAVTNGSGSGSAYTNHQQVAITAAIIPGSNFTYWTGNTNYLVTTNVYAATNTVVMGTRNLQLTANYAETTYTLTVGNGTGGGTFSPGTPVTITANPPPTNWLFDQWTGDTGVLASNTASTSFSMPAANVTLTAQNKPDTVTLTGEGSTGGTISPTSTNVAPSSSATFVITANSYYRISTLQTNGSSVGVPFDNNSTSTNFTWVNVQAPGTVTVSFVQQVTTNCPAPVPYEWLASYFTTNDYNACALADQDTDGMKTWQEWIAGTVPTNKASCLTAAQTNRNVVTWSPVTGRVYSVYWTTNLTTKAFAALGTNIVYPQGSYTNAAPDPRVNQYQVRVKMQ